MHYYNQYWDRLRNSIKYQPSNRFRCFLVKKLLQTPKIGESPSIVDVGCGDGDLLTFVATILPKAHLTGVDISEEQIAVNARQHPEIAFATFDAGGDDFPSELGRKFDIVLSCEVIEHVADDEKFINNVLNLLKPGGILLLTTISGQLYRLDKEILGHFRSYDRAAICTRLESKGVSAREAYNTGFPIFSLQKRLVNIFYNFVIKTVASGCELGPVVKTIMSLMYYGMVLCRRIPLGPQLVIVGELNAHDE